MNQVRKQRKNSVYLKAALMTFAKIKIPLYACANRFSIYLRHKSYSIVLVDVSKIFESTYLGEITGV